jgi:UDP-N-acetylmuramate--alanine ligase
MSSTQQSLLEFNQFYLMGIKGVAMTSLAQILIQADKQVRGCDVKEEFVTQKMLDQLPIKFDLGFDHSLPEETEVVVYTAAHNGPENPVVQQAKQKNIPTFSQAEALSLLANQKKNIAVCGVGGKSTVSAMITWILTELNYQPSFSVGVGDIIGLNKTGQWTSQSDWFVAEADEYVTNPDAAKQGKSLIPRFSYLKPEITVCTNLNYDHPDVYQDLDHTKQTFAKFFNQIQPGGRLIYNADCPNVDDVVKATTDKLKNKNIDLTSFGESDQADLVLLETAVKDQNNWGRIKFSQNKQTYQLKLRVPGKFNLFNAMAAILAVMPVGITINDAISALASFQSTMRRFELVRIKDKVVYLDDYAHHPDEIRKTISAFKNWYPDKKKVVAFQPHTYSRTKQLFDQFVQALATASEVILLDIFPSAREKYDPTISSDLIVEKIRQEYPKTKINNLKTISSLADYCQNQLEPGSALMTMGAGDIYKVHQQF